MEQQITVPSVFSKAWSLVHGCKGAIWNIAILIILITITLKWFVSRIHLESTYYFVRYLIFPIIRNIAISLFFAGSIMVAIKHTRNESVDIKTGFQYFHQFLPIAITMVIIGLISNLVKMIISIPSISYALGSSLTFFDMISFLFSLIVYTFFLLSIPMITDKQYTVGQALVTSPRLVKPYWFQIFSILILACFCILIVITPHSIGLILNSSILMIIGVMIIIAAMIWLIPFLFLLIAQIYHRLLD